MVTMSIDKGNRKNLEDFEHYLFSMSMVCTSLNCNDLIITNYQKYGQILSNEFYNVKKNQVKLAFDKLWGISISNC
jgi:hypothetical protein